jgi:hypothetical protein
MKGYVTVRWEVEDGYVGGSRPQRTHVPLADFDEEMDDGDIANMIEDYVRADFEQNISWEINNEDEAIRVIRKHFEK